MEGGINFNIIGIIFELLSKRIYKRKLFNIINFRGLGNLNNKNVIDFIINFIFKKIDFYNIVKIITVNNTNLLVLEIYSTFVFIYKEIIKFLIYKNGQIIIIIYFIKFFDK